MRQIRLPGGRLRRAELVCWLLAGLLALPQLMALAAREALAAGARDDWSASRRAAYERLLGQAALPAPVAELRLPDQHGRVPIFAGTSETVLTLGAGHLADSAALTGDGNIAIAGHRDGFFRALRHLAAGDRLVLQTVAGTRTFEVTDTRVVQPEDVWVLDPTRETTLTLITCHPFYFVGSAPERYVVQARLTPPQPADLIVTTNLPTSD